MSIDLKRYQKLKADVDRLQRERDRAEGALAETMRKLEEDHGCNTLKQAERMAAKARREANAAERAFGEGLDEFEDKWREVLDGR